MRPTDDAFSARQSRPSCVAAFRNLRQQHGLSLTGKVVLESSKRSPVWQKISAIRRWVSLCTSVTRLRWQPRSWHHFATPTRKDSTVLTILSFLFFTGLVAVTHVVDHKRRRPWQQQGLLSCRPHADLSVDRRFVAADESFDRANGRTQRCRLHRRTVRDGLGSGLRRRAGLHGLVLLAAVSQERRGDGTAVLGDSLRSRTPK